ncbi:MAG TPA: 5,6-dimethylbenzimidazole synthase [Albidovulum sp.]|uniref:5,6-dimethylbenzimidazole synthase n=1 Tax=Albidovulum sp. TaxID=1872424 RepID=UPI002B7AA30C|nr:5,6-dimethylbenzimidazole synthase [Albidovulum sp.]
MKFETEDAACLERILTWRRDVRHFLTDPVPEVLIDRLTAAMAFAPSVGNARPWRVIRVEDPALRAAIRANFEEANRDAASAYDDADRAEYLRLKLAGLDAAPVHLAVFTETEPDAGRGLGRRTLPETLMQSTAMAIHTLWLAARAENLGLGMVSILDPKAVEALFAIPPSWRFSAYLCLGWPAFTDDTPLLHRAHWQENQPTRWERR